MNGKQSWREKDGRRFDNIGDQFGLGQRLQSSSEIIIKCLVSAGYDHGRSTGPHSSGVRSVESAQGGVGRQRAEDEMDPPLVGSLATLTSRSERAGGMRNRLLLPRRP